MLTLDQHFAAGYQPAAIGAYFNLSQLLAEHAESPVVALRHAVAEEVPRLRQTGERVKDNVRLVQALAELAGFQPPSPPRTPEEYFAWFQAVHKGFRATLPTHHRGEVAQLVGHRIGDIACAWNVLVLTLRLLISDPGSLVLERQMTALREDLAATVEALRISARHPNLPPALFPLTELVSFSVDELLSLPLTDAGIGELAVAGQRLNERLRELSVAVRHAEEALRADTPAAEA